MDKKSKILITVFLLLIIGAVAATYYRVFVKKDYIISAQPDCDPTVEKCFIYICDPSVEECTGDPEEDTFYFKKIKKKAANIPLCDPGDEECQSLECAPGEKDCEIIYCDEETIAEGETCNDPEEYVKNNPDSSDEEALDCDPEIEDCAVQETGEVSEESDEAESEENVLETVDNSGSNE